MLFDSGHFKAFMAGCAKIKQKPLRYLSNRYFAIPAALLLMYTLLGSLVAPVALQWYLPIFAKGHFNSVASVGKVKVNPFLLTIDAGDFSLKGPDGALLAGVGRVFLHLAPGGLFDGTAKFGELLLENPDIHIQIDPDGAYNFAQLAPQPLQSPASDNSKSPASNPLRMILEHFTVTGGKVTLTDLRLRQPTVFSISDISVESKNLSTIVDRSGAFSFSARTADGESVELQGEISLVPFRSKGRLTCSRISVKTPWGFFQNRLNLDSPGGKINLSTDYSFASSDPSVQLVLENLRMDLAELSLKLLGHEEFFFALDKFDLDSAKFDLASKTVRVGKILLEGGKARVHIDSSGRLNIQGLGLSWMTSHGACLYRPIFPPFLSRPLLKSRRIAISRLNSVERISISMGCACGTSRHPIPFLLLSG